MELTCPKCQGAMRSYERNGVTIDQCSDCRGIFLDRGELERLVDAENAWHGAPRQPEASREQSYREPRREGSYGGQGGDYGTHPKKRRKSFLDELFD
jgi:Zn-finger nucleic acid-binding protein